MKLAVLGGNTTIGASFVNRATKHGFDVEQLLNYASFDKPKSKKINLTVGSYNNEINIVKCIRGSHAVICMSDFYNDINFDTMLNYVVDSGIKRLIIAETVQLDGKNLDNNLAKKLNKTQVDWTIVKYFEHGEHSALENTIINTKDFMTSIQDSAKFIFNQITDSRYLQSTVLIKN